MEEKQTETEKAKEELKKLQEQVKHENHFFDDHGPVIIGDRDQSPIFPESF